MNTRENIVRYSFYHDTIGNVVIEEPKGFREDNSPEFARNTKYDGIFTTITSNLQFMV